MRRAGCQTRQPHAWGSVHRGDTVGRTGCAVCHRARALRLRQQRCPLHTHRAQAHIVRCTHPLSRSCGLGKAPWCSTCPSCPTCRQRWGACAARSPLCAPLTIVCTSARSADCPSATNAGPRMQRGEGTISARACHEGTWLARHARTRPTSQLRVLTTERLRQLFARGPSRYTRSVRAPCCGLFCSTPSGTAGGPCRSQWRTLSSQIHTFGM